MESRRHRARGSLVLLVVLVLEVAPWIGSGSGADCPAGCWCLESSRTASCSGLTTAPSSLPRYIQTLSLTGGDLVNLHSLRSMSQLTALNVSSNQLRRLEPGLFSGLSALRSLDLSDNPLCNVPPGALQELLNLSSLHLSRVLSEKPDKGNDEHEKSPDGENVQCAGVLHGLLSAPFLRILDLSRNDLMSLTLTQLPTLREVDLRYNSLCSLSNITFSEAMEIEFLDLRNNKFEGVSVAELEGLKRAGKNGVHMRLSGNPFVCDCELRDFVSWLMNHSDMIQDLAEIHCASPAILKGAILSQLTIADLSCELGPQLPVVLQTSYVFLGLVLAVVGVVFLLVLYLNRQGIKRWAIEGREFCLDRMANSYYYRYEHEVPQLAGGSEELTSVHA
uniref:trophoblast glycoprotein-like n=1 Tax=Myxine glutinosa TaxID=7769 RepID=UPI00358E9EDC